MRVELTKELEDDKQVHEMLTCWCKTNKEDKTKAIELGGATSSQLESSMDEATAKIVELKETRKGTLAEIDANHAALQTASALRMREGKAAQAETTDLVEAIKACQQAIVVLSKHHPELAQVRAAARQLEAAHVPQLVQASRGLRALRSDQLGMLKGFLQQAVGEQSFLSIPGYTSYAPQSRQIFGILKQMQEDFEADLAAVQKAEASAQEDHASLKTAKQDELVAGKKAAAQLDEDIADVSEQHAQAAQEFADTQGQLELDRAFLADLDAKCAESGEDFDARVKSRMDEIKAVEETVGILNTDEAFHVFDKTVSTSFLQLGAASGAGQQQQRRARAVALLQRAAHRGGSVQVSLLAASVQVDAFTKVSVEIDKLVIELNKQQGDEVAQRDWCTEELASNGRDTAAADDKKNGLETKIADLEKAVEKLTSDIGAAEGEIAETQAQMKRASELREAENADFLQTVADQRVTQMILAKAIARMRLVYAFEQQQQPGAAHIATSGTHTGAGNGPVRFTKYERSAGGSKVVALLETVKADSAKMEDEALKGDEDAQSFYENFMQGSNKAIAKGHQAINNMSEARAKAKASLSMSQSDLKETVEELGGLSEMLGDVHKSCDFVLSNFDARQAARAAEVDALKEAKAILSGMK